MTAAGWGLGAIVLLALGVVAWGWIINATAGSAVERFINGEGQVYEGDGFSARSARYTSIGRALNGTDRRWLSTTWKMSPARM